MKQNPSAANFARRAQGGRESFDSATSHDTNSYEAEGWSMEGRASASFSAGPPPADGPRNGGTTRVPDCVDDNCEKNQTAPNHAACVSAVTTKLSSANVTPQAQYCPRYAVPITTNTHAQIVRMTSN